MTGHQPSSRTGEISEEQIIGRILAGETDLYSILAVRYHRRVYHFVRRMLRNDMDAEDITQEAHLRALTYLHRFRGACKFATWLNHIAGNLAYRQLEYRQRRTRLFEGMVSASRGYQPILTSSMPDPESRVRDREARVILRKALSKLPQHYQLIFLMKEIDQVATPEIARRLRIRQNNVRLRLHRARLMLRRAIDYESQ